MKRHALFVGVNAYDDKTIRSLRFSIPDASVLQDRFRGLGYETRLLPDPTAAELKAAVAESVEGLGPGDVFLFFFAGHGFTAQDGGHLLFCRDDRAKLLRVNSAGVRVDAIEALTDEGGFHRAFLLDSCRTDCFADREARGAETRDLDLVLPPTCRGPQTGSFFLLRSCDRFRPSLEFSELGHGLFTQGLLDAMDAGDGRLAQCDSLFAEAVRERMEALQRSHSVDAFQRPSIGECCGPAFPLFGPGAFSPRPAVPAFAPVREPEPKEEVPYDFSWAPTEGGRIAFRILPRCDLARVGVSLAAGSGDMPPPVLLSDLRAGEPCEGLLDAAPADALPADFRVEAEYGTRARERFRASLAAPSGEGGEGFRPVRFLPEGLRRESVRLCAAGAAFDELLVLPGADLLRFGRPSRRTEGTLDGAPLVVSRQHFSLLRSRSDGTILLRDGAPGEKETDPWVPSDHGLAVDGAPLLAPLPLPPNRRLDLVLAPRAGEGGALSLSIETAGWDDPAAADWPFRDSPLSSLLVRRGDNPRKAILVVWGAVALDPVLGTSSGLRVVSYHGRLHLSDSDGRLRRLPFLTGRVLPGTPYAIR